MNWCLAYIIALLILAFPGQSLAYIVNLQASADTFISTKYPSTNYGTVWWLTVSGSNVRDDEYGVTRTLIDFDISQISVPSGYVIGNIQSATLYMYQQDYLTATSVMDLYIVNQAWSESLATWDTSPSYLPTSISSANTVPAGWMAFTGLSSVVQGWLDDPASNYGFLIKLRDESEGSEYFNQRQVYWADPNYLHIEYTLQPSGTVPEPATILLYGLGFAGAGLYRRMRRPE